MGIREILSSSAVVAGVVFAHRRAVVLRCRAAMGEKTRKAMLLLRHVDGAAP